MLNKAQPWAAKLIYIVGCDHAMQVEPRAFEDNLECQRAHYEKELKALASYYRFTLYCEEIKHTAYSIAEDFAIRRRKRYVNIDFPAELRCPFGIPNDYAASLKPALYTPEQIGSWHRIREDFMFHRATARMRSPEVVALVICGDDHRSPLKRRFERNIGCLVEDRSFLKEKWYDPRQHTYDDL